MVRVGFGGGTPEEDHGLQWAQCRQAALGHQWKHDPKPIDPELNKWGFQAPISMPAESYGFRSVCSYCHTNKVKWVAARGYETVTRYYHPDGYSRTGAESLDAEEWRRVWIVSSIPSETNGAAASKQAS